MKKAYEIQYKKNNEFNTYVVVSDDIEHAQEALQNSDIKNVEIISAIKLSDYVIIDEGYIE